MEQTFALPMRHRIGHLPALMLSIRNFSKSYSGEEVIAVKSMDFSAGIYWIKGENGSGKTTLFRALAGLHTCRGKVTISGIGLHEDPIEYRKKINYSEAEPIYPDFLTPKELIRYVGSTKGASRTQQEYYSSLFGVKQFEEKPCAALSSGMLKKLSITLAFLGQPSVLILDEPFITLDEKAREVLLSAIHELSVQRNVIFLISSHQAFATTEVCVDETFLISNKQMTPLA